MATDPNKPNIAKIVREMESNKTEGQTALPTRRKGGAAGSRSGKSEEDRRTHGTHLPQGVFPSAAGTPSAAPALPGGGAVGNPAAAAGFAPPGRQGGGAGAWHPPGWDEFARSQGLPGSKARPRSRREKLGEERPPLEVWGMRIVGVLLLAVVYLEVKDLSWSPTGSIKKAQPRRYEKEE